MSLLYLVHVGCALLSISGFALRGFWMLTGNALLAARPTKVLPHIIDTLLLGSEVAMLVQWGTWPWQAGWLMAKIVALLAYIGFGMAALRFGRSRAARGAAYGAALLCAGYIVSVAFTRSPLGPLALL